MKRLGKFLGLSVWFYARVSDAFMQTEKRAVIDAVLFKYVENTGLPPIVVGWAMTEKGDQYAHMGYRMMMVKVRVWSTQNRYGLLFGDQWPIQQAASLVRILDELSLRIAMPRCFVLHFIHEFIGDITSQLASIATIMETDRSGAYSHHTHSEQFHDGPH